MPSQAMSVQSRQKATSLTFAPFRVCRGRRRQNVHRARLGAHLARRCAAPPRADRIPHLPHASNERPGRGASNRNATRHNAAMWPTAPPYAARLSELRGRRAARPKRFPLTALPRCRFAALPSPAQRRRAKPKPNPSPKTDRETSRVAPLGAIPRPDAALVTPRRFREAEAFGTTDRRRAAVRHHVPHAAGRAVHRHARPLVAEDARDGVPVAVVGLAHVGAQGATLGDPRPGKWAPGCRRREGQKQLQVLTAALTTETPAASVRAIELARRRPTCPARAKVRAHGGRTFPVTLRALAPRGLKNPAGTRFQVACRLPIDQLHRGGNSSRPAPLLV